MRPRTVAILLLVVVALLAFIWFYERDLPSSEERSRLAKRVVRWQPERITAVEIELGEQLLKLERIESDEPEATSRTAEWRIVTPLEAYADRGLLEELLGDLSTLEIERNLESVVPEELGLEPPRARLWIHSDEDQVELLLGSEVPAASSMIVSSDGGETAFVVADSFWPAVERDPGDWRSRDVFHGDRDDVERIQLIAPDRRVVLARRGEDFWIESPIDDRAHEERVRDLLTDLTGLRVTEFVDAAEETSTGFGLDSPGAAIEVVLSDQDEPFRIEWGGVVPETEGHYLARVEGQIFETDSDLGEAIDRPVGDWQSLAVTSLDAFQIDLVEVIDQDHPELRLQRAGADWKRGEDEISFTSVSDLLYSLTEARAERLVTEEQVQGLGPDHAPSLEITLTGGDRRETVSFFAPTEEGVPVTLSGRAVVPLLKSTTVDDIREKLQIVRDFESRMQAVEIDEESPASELSSDDDG